MNDTDRDLVMALAQGNLSTIAAGEAAARIEADPELAAEFAEQVMAVQFLQSAVPPMMSEAERSTLRTNLTTQLGLLPVATSGAVVPTKKSRWWAPALGMATAAVVVAAFVIFPGAQQESFQEVSMQPEDTSTSGSQAAESSPQTTAAATAAAEQSEGIQSDSAAALPLAGGDPVSVYDTDSVALDELLAQADGADSPESIQRQMSGLSFKASVDVDSDEVNACLDKLSTELPDEIHEIFVIGADVEGDRTTIHIGFDSGEGVEGGMSLVLETCELVDSSPGG
jgi:hypothetical protein